MFFLCVNKQPSRVEDLDLEHIFSEMGDYTYKTAVKSRWESGSQSLTLLCSQDCHVDFSQSGSDFVLLHGDMHFDGQIIRAQNMIHVPDDNWLSYIERKGGRGNFIAFKYNKKNEQLQVINDPLGIHPVFIFENESYIIFSSLPHWVLSLPLRVDINWDTIVDYILFGATLPETSPYMQMQMMTPSSSINIVGNQIYKKSYSHPLEINFFSGNLNEAAESYFHAITKAIDRLKLSYQVKQCFLTGGSDSRILLAAMSESIKKNIEFIVYENAEWSQGEYDVQVARALALKHKLNLSVIPASRPWKVLPDAAKGFHPFLQETSTLTGSFGSEVTGGVPLSYFGLPPDDLSQKKFIDKYRSLLGVDNPKLLSQRFDFYWNELLEQPGPNKEYSFLVKRLWRSHISSLYSGNNTGNFIYPYLNIIKQKISPFLDDSCLELLLSFPREFVQRYTLYSKIFEKYLGELSLTPLNSNMCDHVLHYKPYVENKLVGTKNQFDHKSFVLDNFQDSFLKDGPFNLSHIKHFLCHDKVDFRNKTVIRLCDLIIWHVTHFSKSGKPKSESFIRYSREISP